MSNFDLPQPPDSTSFWGYTPQKETLYGSNCVPRKFLRIIDALPGSSAGVFHTYEDEPGNPDSLVIVETVAIDNFIQFVTFGYTPYLEAAMCGLKNSIGLEEHKHLFLAQSTYRNYEKRARILLDILQEKKYSLASIFGDEKTRALKDELTGVLYMWEMLMNTGMINPTNCLSYSPNKSSNTLKSLTEKFTELEQRTLMENCAPLKFKVTHDEREQILKAFH